MKIPKGQSEAVNRRRTDYTIAKRKRTNNDLQNTTQKINDVATRTPSDNGGGGVNSGALEGGLNSGALEE